MQTFFSFSGFSLRKYYWLATTRNSSAAATVACGEVVLQLQLKPEVFVQE